MLRSLLRLILGFGLLLMLAVTALTLRTPARSRQWLAEYDSTKHYLATADANFDWIAARKKLDLPGLDSATRDRVAHSWSSLSAAWTVRSFVRQFDDGHTRARIRPALWWQGVRGATADPASSSATEIAEPHMVPAEHMLHSSMSAAEACNSAGLDVNARPDGWSLPFPDAAGAELMPDAEFPAVIVPLPGGRKVGVLRVASFGHEHFGPSCERAWAAYRTSLPVPCTGDCVSRLDAAVMREAGERAAHVARELQRRGADAVVVDLTGNGGGSEMADAMARALTDTQLHLASSGFIRHPLHVDDLREMREAIASDSARATPAQRVLIAGAEARIDSLLAEAEAPCDRDPVWIGDKPGCSNVVLAPPLASYVPPGTLAGLENGWVIWPATWHGAREGIYSSPLLVLQDHRSASASEEFAARLRDNNAATIIGSRSYGAGCGYSNGGTSLELRALGLLVRAPDCQRLRMDGSNETMGVAPDVDAVWSEGDSGVDSVRKAIAAVESVVRVSQQ
ncbi:MAG TPA: S41 family peptidase [Gemmatimonadales bacterium]|nr:S41 family peptidase [Gemmatimonadales bacterium]